MTGFENNERAAVAQARYWRIVHDCLTVLHHLSPREADDAITQLQERLALQAGVDFPSMTYHAEPFDVACDIVGELLDYAANREAYEGILARASIGPVGSQRSASTPQHS